MTTPFEGGCMCGAVRYRCTGEPMAFINCHCRECRYVSGGNAAAVLIVARDAFELTRGETQAYDCKTRKGNIVTRRFCAKCGTPLFSDIKATPAIWGIKAGTLDDASWLKPSMTLWKSSAPPWAHIDETLPVFAQDPQ